LGDGRNGAEGSADEDESEKQVFGHDVVEYILSWRRSKRRLELLRLW
jgi:hypothetical protein